MNEYVDEAGMPIHLPMPVNKYGQGPLSDDDPDIRGWVCWCGTECMWNQAFAKAYLLAFNQGIRDGFRQGLSDYE